MRTFMTFVRDFKGAIASCLGFLMAFPCNLHAVFKYFQKTEFTEAELIALCVVNGIAMIWFILPSKIKIDGKWVKIDIED